MNIDELFLHLKKEISQNEYEQYIKNLEYNDFYSQGGLITFNAPNMIVAKWVQKKFSKKIAKAYEEIYNKKVQIKISHEEQIIKLKPKKRQKANEPNSHQTFKNLVVSGFNEESVKIAQEVAKKEQTTYNPCVIYGDVGLGKTHLLNAIGNYALELDCNALIIYITSEQFLTSLQESIDNKKTREFKARYRNCDFLLIDDIQFLTGKKTLQDEFFHTFNDLKQKGGKLIMTCDKNPKDLDIEKRITSRLQEGINIEIKHPNKEEKISLFKAKCDENKILIKQEFIIHIANHLDYHSNIRHFEGIINRLKMKAELESNKAYKLSDIDDIIDTLTTRKKETSLEEIIKATANITNIKQTEIKSKTRHKSLAYARKLIIILAKKLTQTSNQEIANALGFKNQSSVSKAIKNINEEIDKNPDINDKLNQIESKIKNNI